MTDQTQTVAWHNDFALKEKTVAQMRAHREADEFLQLAYREPDPLTPSGFRGCFLGCILPQSHEETIKGCNWHSAAIDLFGLTRRVVIAAEAIFDNLPSDMCADFAVDVVETIPVGADLDGIGGLWILSFEDPAKAAVMLLDALRSAPVPVKALA